ncbi:MAG: aminoacyl-histidine dipeptidase [Bacteroidales bacterium]
MKSIVDLAPQNVWKHFNSICSIPHPSYQEEEILAFIKDFAHTHSLSYYQDNAGNIIITKQAHKGYESCETICLQAHVDMVPQKAPESSHNFTKDPIKPFIDGDWVRATHTTLGADNGIGLACILAILESATIKHGPLEALFTTTEETGMIGAYALKPHKLQAKYLINTDTEDEHDITIGCAGGIDGNFICKAKNVPCPAPDNTVSYTIHIDGLTGGHSGFEIMYNRANAALIIGELIHNLHANFNAQLVSVDAGDMRNAIPRNAQAQIIAPQNNKHNIQAFLESFITEKTHKHKQTDPFFSASYTEVSVPKNVISFQDTHAFTKSIISCPNGVISYDEKQNSVQTSTNISIIKTHAKHIEINCLLRSSDTHKKMQLSCTMSSIFSLYGLESHFDNDYPAWEPKWNSDIITLVEKAYSQCSQTKPSLQVVHAGLECGLLQNTYPDIEFISIGPNIRGPHSPDEKVEIRTVSQFWDILLYILEHCPKLY